MDLLRAGKISASQMEVLRHSAELNVVRTQDMTKLAKRFLGTNVRTRISRAVVSGKEQLEFLSWLPALALTEYPTGLGALNVAADPSLENKVHHAAEPPAWAGHSR